MARLWSPYKIQLGLRKSFRSLRVRYSPRNLEDVKNIVAPILSHYGDEDERINKGIPATEEAMKKYNKTYIHKIYPGAGHAFNNDTRKSRYNPEAAKEAWKRTLDFFKKNLSS